MSRIKNINVGDALPERAFKPDTAQLFLYDAALWNAHRIHFDYPYATEVEGYPGLVIAGPSAPPLGGAVAKAAAGQLGRVKMAREQVAADALTRFQNHGYWIFAADAAGTALQELRSTERWVLCVGAEEKGLRAKTRSKIDEFVAIPMAEGVESLNLSVSAGILLWELSKAG